MGAGRRLQNVITLNLEHLDDHLAQGIFILGHEDGFATVAKGVVDNRLHFFDGLMAYREIGSKSSAVVRFALHLQPAVMLADNAEYGGQAQTSTVFGSCGGEKWFKDPVENLRVHPGAVVTERQADEFPVPAFRIHWRE